MIMLKLKNADQETKIDFPCLHEHIRYRLEEIGLDGANAPKVLVREVEAPRALSFLEGLEVNVDEINYLANEIESLEEIQAEKLYAIISKRRSICLNKAKKSALCIARNGQDIAVMSI